MIAAEFVGGPWDGEVREYKIAMPRIVVPTLSPLTGYNEAGRPIPLFDEWRYHRTGNAQADASTGKPVYRYELRT